MPARLRRFLKGLRILGGQIGHLGETARRPIGDAVSSMRKRLGHSPRAAALHRSEGLALGRHRERSFLLQADLDSVIERRLAYDGVWEEPILDLLVDALEPGALAIDVGANVGALAIPLARAASRLGGRVLALEPLADLADRLEANARANRLDPEHLTVLRLAAAAEPGERTLFVPQDDAGNRGLAGLSRRSGVVQRQVPVTTVRLDDLVVEQAPNIPVTVLKVDVEGAELEVLEGARELLARHRPTVVVEVTAPGGAPELADLFRELGYGTFSLLDRVESFLPRLDLARPFTGDVLAVPAPSSPPGRPTEPGPT